MRGKTVKAALVGLLIAAMFYVSSYGLVRWRKLLVRREYYSNMKAGPPR